MTNLVHFTEAAHLYAEYAAVVELMQNEFLQSMSSFLDSMATALNQKVRPEILQAKATTASYRYWWLAEEPTDMEKHPLLWIDGRQPSIVNSGRFAMTVCAPKALKDERARYVVAAQQSELAPYCSAIKGGPWSLFTFTITYADGDPFETLAEPVGCLLLLLRKVERQILGAS
jgi:hypothetical protein